jgi:hypothetical protein
VGRSMPQAADRQPAQCRACPYDPQDKEGGGTTTERVLLGAVPTEGPARGVAPRGRN